MPKEFDPPLFLHAGGLRQVGLHVENPLSHPVHSQPSQIFFPLEIFVLLTWKNGPTLEIPVLGAQKGGLDGFFG